MNKKVQFPQRMCNDIIFSSDLPIKIGQRTMAAPYPTHSHEFYEIEFILCGEGIHVLNGQDMVIGKNSFYLLTPADFHSVAPATDTICYYNIMFSRACLSDGIAEELLNSPRPFAGTFNEDCACRFVQILERMLYESQCDDLRRHTMLRDLIDIALCDILRALSPSVPNHTQHISGMQRALQYMEHNFRSKLALVDVAEYVHLSPSYFSLQFRQSVGKPFSAHLHDLRLEYAHNLIQSSVLSVGEVCESSGFGSMAYFIRSFRARYGCTPGDAKGSTDKNHNKNQ